MIGALGEFIAGLLRELLRRPPPVVLPAGLPPSGRARMRTLAGAQ